MKRIFTKRGEQKQFEPQHVLYLIGDVNYSHVHLLTGEVILTCRTLKWFAQQWPTFIRLHKKALVNVNYIQRYQQAKTSTGTSYVVMHDTAQLPVARRRVLDVFSQLIQRGLAIT